MKKITKWKIIKLKMIIILRTKIKTNKKVIKLKSIISKIKPHKKMYKMLKLWKYTPNSYN